MFGFLTKNYNYTAGTIGRNPLFIKINNQEKFAKKQKCATIKKNSQKVLEIKKNSIPLHPLSETHCKIRKKRGNSSVGRAQPCHKTIRFQPWQGGSKTKKHKSFANKTRK